MANLVKNPNSNVGKTPTPSQKLAYVSDKVGVPGIKDMQGSSVNLVDTVMLTTNAGRQVLNFFNATSNKSKNFSNFQQGKLPAGGSLVCSYVSFIYLVLTTANLNDDANVIVSATPLSGVAAALMPMNLGQLSLSIANSKTIDSYQIHESLPHFNPATTGIATFNAAPMGQNRIPLESAPVLPPNQAFQLDLAIPPITAPSFAALMCVVGRFGSIYAAKTTL